MASTLISFEPLTPRFNADSILCHLDKLTPKTLPPLRMTSGSSKDDRAAGLHNSITKPKFEIFFL